MRKQKNATREKPSTKRRVVFTLLTLFVVRMLTNIPVIGVDPALLEVLYPQNEMLKLFNLFSGGGLNKLSLFSLSISPYISASISLQLFGVIFSRLEEIQQQGELGRRAIERYTKYATFVLATISAWGVTKGFMRMGALPDTTTYLFLTIGSLVAGTHLLVWIGEQITEKGIGNGISLILIMNILSQMPQDALTVYDRFLLGKTNQIQSALPIVAFVLLLVFFTVRTNNTERRIPLIYPGALQNRSFVGEEFSSLTLKVNPGGVMPVIFTTTIMAVPSSILALLGKETGFWGGVVRLFQSQNWFNPADPLPTVGYLLYAGLLVLFSYQYTKIAFNTKEIANTLKRQQATVANVRPGKETEAHLKDIVDGVVLIGAIRLCSYARCPCS